MRIQTAIGLALILVACEGSSTTNPFEDVPKDAVTSDTKDVSPDGDATLPDGDATLPDGDATLPDGTDAAPDGDAVDPDTVGPDAGDVDPDAVDPDAADSVDDADVSPPDAADSTDTEDTQEDVAPPDCSAVVNPCPQLNSLRCATEGDTRVQKCVLSDGCLVWFDSEICEEANLCTGKPDVCEGGECLPDGDPDAGCDTPSDECVANLCNPFTGECELQPIDNFDSCEDFNVCTDDDICFNESCGGNVSCPKQCILGDASCNQAQSFKLSDGTSVMDAYGCSGADSGYTGFEESLLLKNNSGDACGDFRIGVELADPKLNGKSFADVFLLSKTKGICWPQDCLGSGFMGKDGRALIETSLATGDEYIVVVDGRDGFIGDVRVTTNCCGGNPAELFCTNGQDDDGDGLTDCDDDDCFGDKVCDFEHICDDGINNDGQGGTDCADSDCANAPACTPEISCEDNIDDDEDGLTDCEDPACDAAAVCGGGCPDATILECGDSLLAQTTAGGVATFIGETVGTCGGDNVGISYSGNVGLFGAAAPAGCSARIKVTSSNTFHDLYMLGPGCSLDACQEWDIFFSETTINMGALPFAWFMVADATDGSGKNAPYDITLECECP